MKRMKREWLTLSLSLLWCWTSWGQPAYAAGTQADVETLLATIASAFDRRDLNGVVATAVPDAEMKYANGQKLVISEWQRITEQEFVDTATMKSTFKLETADLPSGTVTYNEVHEWTLKSEPGRQYKSVSRWRAGLVETPTGLRFRNFEELAETVTRDGVEIPVAETRIIPGG